MAGSREGVLRDSTLFMHVYPKNEAMDVLDVLVLPLLLLLQILGQILQPLCSSAQGVEILAEGKTGVYLSDATVFLTVELSAGISVLVFSPQDGNSPR